MDARSGLRSAPKARFAWWRRRWRRLRRTGALTNLYPRLEIVAVALTILIGWSSYALLTGRAAPVTGVSPPLVTALVVANLLPLMVLVVLMARRVALLLANRRRGLAGAQLHVRLVALFAGIAAVPTVLVVIFASLLFQFGVQFWFSDRVKTILEGSNQVAQAYVEENRQRVAEDIVAMSSDVSDYARDFGAGSALFAKGLQFQVAARNLSEAAVFQTEASQTRPLALNGLDAAALKSRLARLPDAPPGSGPVILTLAGDRIEGIVAIDGLAGGYVYVSRKVDPAVLARADRAAGALDEYRALVERSRVMQLRFNLVLIAVSVLTLVVAMWFALWLANRLVTPIARLALAAERVGAGDLDARVPVGRSHDEIGTLARAFNRMTGQLKTQQAALLGANQQLDRRRRFTEAVLSGVSAGVMSIDGGGVIKVANRSAAALLEADEAMLIGEALAAAVPEMAALLALAQERGDVAGEVAIARGAETQTLSVRIAPDISADGREDVGYVLTFDDISAQLADQRRAAWADVARRIAHEIKNPLTPIQLAAERLQRRFGKQIHEDSETYAELTGTIVRQVRDLHRMVNEFSDFARLPRPIFAPAVLDDIVHQSVVLEEVVYPQISFGVSGGTASPLACDAQQVGRMFVNLLKNAAESVAARLEREPETAGRIDIAILDGPDAVYVTINDNGVGLPVESRERLTEPYVTTRARGTGLGLAIVKKIVEDHGGALELDDAPGGGAQVRVRLSRRLMVADAPMPVGPARQAAE
jgi:two-component system nitrogen regulation sensor histidine kinase NtrY